LDELRRCLNIVSDSCARVALIALGVYEAGFEALGISPEELAKMLREATSRSLRNGGCLEIAVGYFVDSVGLKRAVELLGEDLAFSARSDDLWHVLRPWVYLDPDGTLSIVSRAPYEFLRDFLDWLADDVAWTGRFKSLADLAKKLDPEHDGNVVEDVADSVSSVLVVLRRVKGIEEFVEKWLWLDPVPVLSNALRLQYCWWLH